MSERASNATQLLKVQARLGDAAVDPAIWPEIMEQISACVGATGAALLQSDIRTPDIPRTAGVDEVINSYFAHGWHTQDVRAVRGVPLLVSGKKVVSDQDIVTTEEIRQSVFFNELLMPHGFKWWAVVGFWAGTALWGLALQRSAREGPFEASDKRTLAQFSSYLTATATLSKAVGRAVILGATNTLQLIKEPALVLDRQGFVIDMNQDAAQVFDNEIRVANRRLVFRDQRAMSSLNRLLDQLRTTPDTGALPVAHIVVQRLTKRPLLIRVLPVDGAARTPFLGARALLVCSDLSRKSGQQPSVLSEAFGLSPAEAKLASLVAAGISPEQAAEALGIARETARNQLKSVFAKTATHRQGELVALLSRL